MLRSFLRLLSRKPQPPRLLQNEADHVVLYAEIKTPAAGTRRGPTATNTSKSSGPHSRVPSHRERLLSMNLEYTKLCSPKRSQQLRDLGIVTAGDLNCADLEDLAAHFGAPKKALRILRQYRRAIRFAASVPGMSPRDAMLLISIHRRSVRGLATESAGALRRDLERFAESTKGRVQLRGRRIPSTRRIKKWIAQCENCSQAPFQARAA